MKELFHDRTHKISSMRVVFVICVLTTIATWATVCIQTQQLQHWTTGDAFFMVALMGGKAAQSLFESKVSEVQS